ncbi:DUF2590 family protein [Marinomonas sp. RSW2]|uniref:DUF2590 family protein n=1 Tax=Marinomonas maritima TaxID=2940935 RepID=A0ABT5WGG1_9GAMM|nr:DUF2590 family protein [Marinomonas maritima]MDE8603892.1 DUF2590 family protein [Marinomonas maritima]
MNSIDLLIFEEDLSLNDRGEPHYVVGTECVAQDIKHMLIERGFLTSLIAERDKAKISMTETNIENAVEDDERILAGSASVVFRNGVVMCTAKTIDDEMVYLEAVLNG